MLTAMLMTMFADTIPLAERASMFFSINAVALAASLFATPFSAFLMSYSPWIPIWVGFTLVMMGNLLVLIFPETMSTDQHINEQAQPTQGSEAPRSLSAAGPSQQTLHSTWNTIAREMVCIWQSILFGRAIMPLLLSFVITEIIGYAKEELMLQYSTKRFGWKWETVSEPFVKLLFSLFWLILRIRQHMSLPLVHLQTWVCSSFSRMPAKSSSLPRSF
jgi:hypothetical protein